MDTADSHPPHEDSPVAPGAAPRLGSGDEVSAVREQHEALRNVNVGWARRDWSELTLSVAGGRRASRSLSLHTKHPPNPRNP